MNKQLRNPYFIASFVFAVLFLSVLVIRHGLAWTNPGTVPPNASGGIVVSGGNVGIGNAAPAYKLDVTGDVNFTGTLRQNGTVFSSGGQWITNGASIYNANSGNVGIGTAVSSVPLHLQKTSSGNYLTLENTDGTTSAGYSEMRLLAGARSGYLWVRNQNGAAGEGDGAFNVYAETGDLNLWAGGARVVNVNKSGNVGIGMTAPAYKLDVQGSAWNNIARIYSTGSSSGIDFWDTGVRRGLVYSDAGGFGFLNSSAGWALRIPYGTSNVVIDNGSLGVGISPSYKLDVSGTVHTAVDFLADGNYGYGLVGVYDPTRYRNVYSMGAAYRLAANGTTPGNLYGIAMSYEPNYGGAGNNAQAVAGLGHQFLFMNNGATQTAIGTGIYTAGNATVAGWATITGSVIAGGGSSSNWASVNAPSFNAGSSIYSYGSICAGNASGNCNSTGGTVIGINNGSATNNIPNTGVVFFNSGNVGIGTTAPASKLSVGGVGDASVAIYGTGASYGLYGVGNNTGVRGDTNSNGSGVYGYNPNVQGTGVYGSGGLMGVYGTGTSYGVYGDTTTGHGVYGYSSGGGNGVYGYSPYGSGNDFRGGGGEYGRAGAWYNASDRNKKENFIPIDNKTILDKIVQLPITQWNYIGDENKVKHIGPVAQDFYAIFGVGDDEKTISTIDPAGISLAGIKALDAKVKDQQQQLDQKQGTINQLTKRVERLESLVK